MKGFIVKIQFYFILSITILFCQNSYAQPDSLAGKKGLTFSINGLYVTGGFGGKYWLSQNNVLRFNLSGEYVKYSDQTINNNEISVHLGFEKHLTVSKEVSPYAGTSIGLSRSETSAHFNVVNVIGFIGVEIWITNSITLSGEQQLSAMYRTNSWNSENRVSIAALASSLLLSVYF